MASSSLEGEEGENLPAEYTDGEPEDYEWYYEQYLSDVYEEYPEYGGFQIRD